MVGVPDYDILFGIEDRKDSLLQLNDNVQYLLGRLHWHHDNNNMLCRSSLNRNHQILHVVEKDGCLLVAELDKNGIKSIQDTLMCQLTSHFSTLDKQFLDKRLLLVDYDWSNLECKRATTFIVYNGLLKRYNFGF